MCSQISTILNPLFESKQCYRKCEMLLLMSQYLQCSVSELGNVCYHEPQLFSLNHENNVSLILFLSMVLKI